MEDLEQRKERGDFEYLPKKEAAKLDDELEKLHRLLGGLAKRYRLPDAVFVVDPHRDAIRAIRLITGKIADAVIEGQQHREAVGAGRDEDEVEDGEEPQTLDV